MLQVTFWCMFWPSRLGKLWLCGGGGWWVVVGGEGPSSPKVLVTLQANATWKILIHGSRVLHTATLPAEAVIPPPPRHPLLVYDPQQLPSPFPPQAAPCLRVGGGGRRREVGCDYLGVKHRMWATKGEFFEPTSSQSTISAWTVTEFKQQGQTKHRYWDVCAGFMGRGILEAGTNWVFKTLTSKKKVHPTAKSINQLFLIDELLLIISLVCKFHPNCISRQATLFKSLSFRKFPQAIGISMENPLVPAKWTF